MRSKRIEMFILGLVYEVANLYYAFIVYFFSVHYIDVGK